MIDTLVNDVKKENQVMKLEEEDAQDNYEKFMADATNKCAADSKPMSDAEGSFAEADEQIVTDEGTLKDKNAELMEGVRPSLVLERQLHRSALHQVILHLHTTLL